MKALERFVCWMLGLPYPPTWRVLDPRATWEVVGEDVFCEKPSYVVHTAVTEGYAKSEARRLNELPCNTYLHTARPIFPMNTDPQTTPLKPEPTVLDIYNQWTSVKRWMSEAKETEAKLRQYLLGTGYNDKLTPAGFLPEGTTKSTVETDEATFKFSVSCSYERKVLEETLAATLAQIPVEVQPLLFIRKPELVKSVYNKLTEEQRKLVDGTLQTKPGSPQLTVEVFPKAPATPSA